MLLTKTPLTALPPKKPKPERVSVVYAHFNDAGEILVETRPDKGLLGGMIGLPGPDWTKTPPTGAKRERRRAISSPIFR